MGTADLYGSNDPFHRMPKSPKPLRDSPKLEDFIVKVDLGNYSQVSQQQPEQGQGPGEGGEGEGGQEKGGPEEALVQGSVGAAGAPLGAPVQQAAVRAKSPNPKTMVKVSSS